MTHFIEECYTVYVTDNKAYLIIDEGQETHWFQFVKTTLQSM